jgi:hypothetical protein
MDPEGLQEEEPQGLWCYDTLRAFFVGALSIIHANRARTGIVVFERHEPAVGRDNAIDHLDDARHTGISHSCARFFHLVSSTDPRAFE